MLSIPLPDPPLGDEVVSLGPFADTEAGILVEACNDPAIAHFTFVPAPYELHHAVEFIGRQHERRENGQAIDLAIRSREGALVGAVGLRKFDAPWSSCEVGYWVTPVARGAGTAPRAVAHLCNWAFDSLGVSRIDLPADTDNRASRRVAEKAGFRLTAQRRETVAKGRRWQMVVYALERPPA